MSLTSFLTSLAKAESLYLESDAIVAMDDFAETYLASDRFGQKKRVERDQQFVLFALAC